MRGTTADHHEASAVSAKTLGEAAQSPDGTYNGARMLSWLSEVLNPGRGATEQEVQAAWDDINARKAARKVKR